MLQPTPIKAGIAIELTNDELNLCDRHAFKLYIPDTLDTLVGVDVTVAGNLCSIGDKNITHGAVTVEVLNAGGNRVYDPDPNWTVSGVVSIATYRKASANDAPPTDPSLFGGTPLEFVGGTAEVDFVGADDYPATLANVSFSMETVEFTNSDHGAN